MFKYLIILLFFPILLVGQGNNPHYQNLEAIKLWKMAEFLELTSDQIAEIITTHRDYVDIRKDIQDEKSELIEELKKIISGQSSENIEEIIDDLIKLEDKIQSLRITERDELFKLLTPIQQGKYFIFQIEFANEMRRYIQEVGGGRGPWVKSFSL